MGGGVVVVFSRRRRRESLTGTATLTESNSCRTTASTSVVSLSDRSSSTAFAVIAHIARRRRRSVVDAISPTTDNNATTLTSDVGVVPGVDEKRDGSTKAKHSNVVYRLSQNARVSARRKRAYKRNSSREVRKEFLKKNKRWIRDRVFAPARFSGFQGRERRSSGSRIRRRQQHRHRRRRRHGPRG